MKSSAPRGEVLPGQRSPADAACRDVPMPIVTLNRWVLVLGILAGLLLRQPLFTTALFGILALPVAFGQRWSVIFRLGSVLFAARNARAEREDRRLMRFNNAIAVTLLGLAQFAFLARLPVVGWILALMVAAAASVALAGFCVGCVLYYQLKLQRHRLLSR